MDSHSFDDCVSNPHDCVYSLYPSAKELSDAIDKISKYDVVIPNYNNDLVVLIIKLMSQLGSEKTVDKTINRLLIHSKYDHCRKKVKEFFMSFHTKVEREYLYSRIAIFNIFMLHHGITFLGLVIEHKVLCQTPTCWDYRQYVKVRDGLPFIKLLICELYTQYLSRIIYDKAILKRVIDGYTINYEGSTYYYSIDSVESSANLTEILQSYAKGAQKCVHCSDIHKIMTDSNAIVEQPLHYIARLYPSNDDLKFAIDMMHKYRQLQNIVEILNDLKSPTRYGDAIDHLLNHREYGDVRIITKKFFVITITHNSTYFRSFLLHYIDRMLNEGLSEHEEIIEEYVSEYGNFPHYIECIKILKEGLPFINILFYELYIKYIAPIRNDINAMYYVGRHVNQNPK